MLNRIAARVFRRLACASLAVACVFALLAACGSEAPYPDPEIHVDFPAPPEATSPEELVYFSSVVARVRLLSASAGVRSYRFEDGGRAFPAFLFRFRVVEYLKGSGDDELTVKVVAIGRYDYTIAPDKNEALMLMIAQSGLDERDTRWDDRKAVVFLRPSPILAEAESGVYEFTDRGDWSPGLYSYDIASSQNRAWLPAAASASPSSSEPRYLAGAPGAQSGAAAAKSASQSATSISLSEMKALVAANAEMAATDFIANDGSVALRLDFDDASETGSGASRAFRWKVCVQPWSGGDLLMLRISESPADLTGAALDAGCSALPTPTPSATAVSHASETEPDVSSATAVSHSSLAAEGATTPEELVFLSSTVARVRLLSAEAGVRRYPPEDGKAPAPVFVFRFRVIEYLKGSGDDELTVRVLAKDSLVTGYHYISASPTPTPDANAALRMAQARLAERDTRWDALEAIVFLRPSPLASESGVYEFSRRYWNATPGLHDYAITSDYGNAHFPNRAWLPGGAPTGGNAPISDTATKDSTAPPEPRYFTRAPSVQPGDIITDSLSPASPSTPSVSLSELKSLVATGEDMLTKGKDIPGYEDCVRARYKFDALYKKYPPEMSFGEIRISSGQPAGHRLWPNPPVISTENHYTKWWFSGPDSDLFIYRITNDPDNNPATGYAWEQVALRPMPEGEYKVFVNNQPSGWAPCGYNPEVSNNRDERTIIATAPDGVVHEAFFDPAALNGGAAGADASNGVLDPTDFTFGGASVSLNSIRWESQAVEMRLSPHTRLANHHADFIAKDGSVALRLDFDDASETGEAASRALSWKVCVQPWSDGDLLMLRISESPTDLTGAALDADCSALPAPTPGAN